ncbi:MAG: hypothetical protein VB082_04160 [Christensenella sp.]|nr:hypothetical protein [Christensenella sp.]
MRRIIAFAVTGLMFFAICASLCGCAKQAISIIQDESSDNDFSAVQDITQNNSHNGSALSIPENEFTISGGGTAILQLNSQQLKGTFLAEKNSSINLTLTQSTLIGAVNSDQGAYAVNVSLDNDSVWELTADSYLTVFTDDDTELGNIVSNEYHIYYDVSHSENSWLGGVTVPLPGGGTLSPYMQNT